MEVDDVVKNSFIYLDSLKKYFRIKDVEEIRLEGVDFDESENEWLVTFSYMPDQDYNPLLNILPDRIYKDLIVDDETGKISTIKMHK